MIIDICRAGGKHLALVAAILALAAGTAFAEYPDKPIRLIVPFSPGGGTDTIARIVGDAISGPLGQQVVVENKPGAAGSIAVEAVAKAPPDGYTLLLGFSTTLTVNPSLYKSNTVNVEKDLVPISTLVDSQYMLVVNPSVKANTVAELVALAKADPGKLNYATGGKGSPLHLAAEMLKTRAKIDMVHIPYRGGGPASKSVMANETQVLFGSFPSSLPKVQAGKLKALAVTGPKRSASLPDVPTMEEAGYPGFLVTTWSGIMAPAGTPQPVLDKLFAVIKAALATESVKKKVEAVGQEIHGSSSPAEFAALINDETASWKKVLDDAGIKAE